MKLLLENWREYIAQEDSEHTETIEKLLRMEFDQAISLINALKADESDNRLKDAYEMALGREYQDSKKALRDRTGEYYIHWKEDDGAPRRNADFSNLQAAEDEHNRLEANWEAMIKYFAEHDEL